VVPQELGSLCKALGFASIKVVRGGANNRETSKQASKRQCKRADDAKDFW
jgi:hypothetical protein